MLLMLGITTRFSPMTDEALSFSRTHTCTQTEAEVEAHKKESHEKSPWMEEEE